LTAEATVRYSGAHALKQHLQTPQNGVRLVHKGAP
jgi:hypothetical protein